MVNLVRLPDWPERLIQFLNDRDATVFSWGTNDCITFAADGVRAITGLDPLEGLRQAWADERQAAALLEQHRGLTRAVRAVLGRELATPVLAQRGDVVLVVPPAARSSIRRFVALCDSDRWVAPRAQGLQRGPMAWAVRGWGVGHG